MNTASNSGVEENPYQLSDDIWGIGFKMADTFAEKEDQEQAAEIVELVKRKRPRYYHSPIMALC